MPKTRCQGRTHDSGRAAQRPPIVGVVDEMWDVTDGAHVRQLNSRAWQVRLHMSGEKSPRLHPDTHVSCEAAEYWLGGKPGRDWVKQERAKPALKSR